MSIDEQIEILKAYKEGKPIQRACIESKVWADIDLKLDGVNFDAFKYRIAPELELIPWTAEDVPMDRLVWLRKIDDSFASKKLVIGIAKNGLDIQTYYFDNAIEKDCLICICWNLLLQDWEYSTDGKTWKPCGKMLEQEIR